MTTAHCWESDPTVRQELAQEDRAVQIYISGMVLTVTPSNAYADTVAGQPRLLAPKPMRKLMMAFYRSAQLS